MDNFAEKYEWITYAWVILISFWGGVARYMERVSLMPDLKISITGLIGDVVISGFVGLVTFFICEAWKVDRMMSAALIGISAHMGSRGLFLFEKLVIDLIKKHAKHDDIS